MVLSLSLLKQASLAVCEAHLGYPIAPKSALQEHMSQGVNENDVQLTIY
jgi:hypothetical protein